MNFERGQSIMEVVIALAIFALIAASFVSLTLGSFTALIQGGDYLTAAALADEGLEAVRAIRDGAWNELIYNQSAATSTSGSWQLVGEGTNETLGQFARSITFTDVCRDALGVPTDCASGVPDLHSKSVQATVDWLAASGVANQVTHSTLFTNWDSRDWVQTDWSSGPGQAIWSDGTRYDSDDGHVDVSTGGELRLREIPPAWSLFVSTGRQIWNDVTCPLSQNCWAVGNSGALADYDGSDWTVSTIPSSANINAVYALSSSDIWAAGANGRFWHYDGSSWSLVQDTGPQTWNDLRLFSAADGFVVGNDGQIWRWDGSVWDTIPGGSGTGQNLNAIHCLSSAECWAVGASGNIVRWDGVNWSLAQDTGNQTWNDLWLFSATDGFVVGNGGQIWRWDGSAWNNITSTGTTQNLNAIHCLSASECWAVGGGGTIIRWNGSAWLVYIPLSSNLRGLFVLTSSDGWAVGVRGDILRLAGGGYEPFGELTSSAFGLSDPSPVQIIDWDEQIPVCAPACSVRFQIRTASDSNFVGVPWSSDFTNAGGTLIPTNYNGQRWAQYRVQLTGDGASTPVLEEVRLNYK